ncbi:MAG: hypothetical protein ACR2QS_03050 [Woeseiaceae bacterium]
MQLPTIPQERQPMVCLLFGLLLVAFGLLVGFDSAAAIGAMIVGLLVSVFGLILFVLQLQERPRPTGATRLSPEFISAGSTVQMPASQAENENSAKQHAAS